MGESLLILRILELLCEHAQKSVAPLLRHLTLSVTSWQEAEWATDYSNLSIDWYMDILASRSQDDYEGLESLVISEKLVRGYTEQIRQYVGSLTLQ